MEPSWHQNRSKIDANCEMRFFEKSCSGCSLGSIFMILGVEVGSKNRSKIDQKTESKMDGILASIFLGFWSILGASWEANWSQDRPKKASKNDAKKKRHEVAQKVAI